MATHSSILVWRIPWTEEPGGLQSIERMGRKTEQTLFKMEMHTISGHEKMSTSLISREMLTKTTVRYHLIPVRT